MNSLIGMADFQGTIDYANEVLREPSTSKNPSLQFFCLSHAAQSYIKTDWSEKAKEYLDSAAAVHADILPEERNSELYIEGFYTYSTQCKVWPTLAENGMSKSVLSFPSPKDKPLCY